MAEAEQSVTLKREIIEARNQAIKTDNQIKNLSMDVRNFEKRFDALESRVRLSSAAVNVLVAVTLAACAYIVTSVMARTYETEIAQLKDAVRDEHSAGEEARAQLMRKLDDAEQTLHRQQSAQRQAQKVLQLIDARAEREAGERLDEVDIAALSPLERQLCETRFAELRKKQALLAFRAGKAALLNHDTEGAIQSWTRSLRLDAEGPMARAAREQLSWALWQAKHYVELEPVVRAWLNKEPDEPSGAARFLLAASLARQGKADAARREFLQVAGHEPGRYAPAAKAYVAALESGEALPVDLPGGRVRPAAISAPASVPPPAAP